MTHTKTDGSTMTFFTGLIIGGLVTALFTPKRGEEMRRSISSRAESMRNNMSDKADEIADTASSHIDKAKNKLERGRNKAADKIDETFDNNI